MDRDQRRRRLRCRRPLTPPSAAETHGDSSGARRACSAGRWRRRPAPTTQEDCGVHEYPNKKMGGLGPGGGADRISALPDDLLLQILERLGFLRFAARTAILSRRWRHLWTCLPKAAVALHDVPFAWLDTELLYSSRPGLCHYLIDIRVPWEDGQVTASKVSLLLHTAKKLSPVELRLTLPRNLRVSSGDVMLPPFGRATSIELQARELHLGKGHAGWGPFHSLEKFSISGCHIDLATFIPRCPRLRLLMLNAIDLAGMRNITTHSGSLQELVVEHKNRWTSLSRISVEAPLLKRLTMSFQAHGNLAVSILAPMLEVVSWWCL